MSAIATTSRSTSPKPKEGQTKLDAAINFPLPKPQVGGTYTKSEAVDIAIQYKQGSNQRRLAIKSMVSMGYVPNSIKSVYRLLETQKNGIPIVDTE